jgi:ubiquinone/menaquinone biosynthesis C-methylase UbiE
MATQDSNEQVSNKMPFDKELLLSLAEYLAKSKQRSYEMLAPGPKDVIADVGCGTGHDAIALVKKGAKVYGIDRTLEYLEDDVKKEAEGLNIAFVSCDAENLKLPDNSQLPNNYLDKIRFERVLQHINDHPKVINEVRRVLKYDGLIQILDTDYLGMTFFLDDEKLERKIVDYIVYERIPNAYKVRSIPTLLEQNNFDIVSVEVHNYTINNYKEANAIFKFEEVVSGLLKKGSISEIDSQNWRDRATKRFYLSINYLLFLAQKK